MTNAVSTPACTKCRSLFTSEDYCKDATRKSGFSPWCRRCRNATARVWGKRNRDKTRIAAHRYKERHPKTVLDLRRKHDRLTTLKRRGLTAQEYDALLCSQGGVCAICGGVQADMSTRNHHLAVDHDHVSGRIRGLLCNRCNTVLGYVSDDADILRRAIGYLERRVKASV